MYVFILLGMPQLLGNYFVQHNVIPKIEIKPSKLHELLKLSSDAWGIMVIITLILQ